MKNKLPSHILVENETCLSYPFGKQAGFVLKFPQPEELDWHVLKFVDVQKLVVL